MSSLSLYINSFRATKTKLIEWRVGIRVLDEPQTWTKQTQIEIRLKARDCLGFPGGSGGKESACSAGDQGSIPGPGRPTGEGDGNPLQDSWVSLVAQLVKNLPAMWEIWVWFLGWEDPLEKGKVTTPVFWPGEFHGLCSPWGRKELDMTERLSLSYWWVNY